MPHEFDEIRDLNEQVMVINFADMNIRRFTNIDHLKEWAIAINDVHFHNNRWHEKPFIASAPTFGN